MTQGDDELLRPPPEVLAALEKVEADYQAGRDADDPQASPDAAIPPWKPGDRR